jgi:hypothetical protein
MVTYSGHRSAPGVLLALAGIVHDRQSGDYEHRHGEDDQKGGFHCDLAAAGPRTPLFFVVQNEPTVNGQHGARIKAARKLSAQYEMALNINMATNTTVRDTPTVFVIVRSSLIGRLSRPLKMI